ncbi:MAG: transcription repressor NadR [Blautia sp.]|jgi:transcriptional regulator of NAD metabolism
MSGEERRQEILTMIQKNPQPISGSALAKSFAVSRQVIVQDIALLRAAQYDIISTTRGYICKTPAMASRVVKVNHTDKEIEEELNIIVDFGGFVKDVFVRHGVYGQLSAKLSIRSRKQVQELVEDISSGKSSPLKNITSGYHYHTILADSEQTLDLIEEELGKRGFLAKSRS